MQNGQRQYRSGAARGVVLCAFVVLSACGSGGSKSETAATTPTTTSAVAPASTDSSAVATTTPTSSTTAKAKRRVDYPGGGIVDPVAPPQQDAYALLISGQCDALLKATVEWDAKGVASAEGEDTVLLYRSAAEACLQRWADAVRDFDRLTKPQPQLNDNCARAEVYKWVAALIQAHRGDPNFAPTFGRSTGRSPCAATTTSSTATSTTSTTSASTTTTTTTTSSRSTTTVR